MHVTNVFEIQFPYLWTEDINIFVSWLLEDSVYKLENSKTLCRSE